MADFTNPDRDQLRAYLVSSKHRLIEYLRDEIKETNAPTFEETALQAREAKGARDIIRKILELASPRQERIPEEGNIDVASDIPR